MDLAITVNPTPERYLVAVSGEVDISNVPELRDAINLALEQPPAVVELDFSQVSYIDSTGIGVLVGAAHHARVHDKQLAVTHAQPNVMRVAQLLGVDELIGITA